jgi:hypothetical protein
MGASRTYYDESTRWYRLNRDRIALLAGLVLKGRDPSSHSVYLTVEKKRADDSLHPTAVSAGVDPVEGEVAAAIRQARASRTPEGRYAPVVLELRWGAKGGDNFSILRVVPTEIGEELAAFAVASDGDGSLTDGIRRLLSSFVSFPDASGAYPNASGGTGLMTKG